MVAALGTLCGFLDLENLADKAKQDFTTVTQLVRRHSIDCSAAGGFKQFVLPARTANRATQSSNARPSVQSGSVGTST